MTAEAASKQHEELSRRRRRWATACYSATVVMLYADQNLNAPNLSGMAKEFGFTELERDQKLGGDIALAFWMTGVPATLLFGCLADRYNRSVLFAVTVIIGETACFLTYFTTTYRQLYTCRAITGFSLGGAMPVIYSVTGDLFRSNERHGINALIAMGSGLGISLGQGIAGLLGPAFGWRLPFLVVSLPALLLATVVLFSVHDPQRGSMETAVLNERHQQKSTADWARLPQGYDDEQYTHSQVELASLEAPANRENQTENAAKVSDDNSDLRYRAKSHDIVFDQEHATSKSKPRGHFVKSFCALLSTRTVLLALVQGVPGCIPWGIVGTFLNDFLSDDRNLSVEFATFALLCFGVGTFLGMVVGGSAGELLYRKDPRYPALLSGSSSMFACFPFWYLLNCVDSNSSILTVVTTTLLTGIGCGITGPIVKATLQNVALPTTRGQAFALHNTFDDFGRGLGPVFVAMLIQPAGGRTAAFNIGVFGWALCGIFNLAMFATVRSDEKKVQRTLVATMTNQKSQ